MSEPKITKKTDYQHIRLRTPMYLGSTDPHTQAIVMYDSLTPKVEEVTWVPALYTAIREIIDNSLDEIIGHGHGNRIDVDFDPATLKISVADNGRGIPFDWDEEHQQYAATLALTEPRAGRNFEERGNVVGTNGIGASAVNITSEEFIVDIYRGGKRFQQKCTEGNLLDGDFLQIGKAKITDAAADRSGTKITFTLSREVYKHRLLPEAFVRSRLTEIAICNPKVRVYYNGTQIKAKDKAEVALFGALKPIVVDIKEDTFTSRFMIVPDWVESGEHVHSLVNNIPAFNGGVHVDTFRRLFYSGLLAALERESKRRKLSPNRSDLIEKLFIYNITTMNAPNFDSQSKTRLINEDVGQIIKRALEDEKLYKDIIKKNPDWIDSIYKRCAERTMKKDAAEVAKLTKKSRLKVENLADATGKDRSKCILMLTEGNSAVAGVVEARDPTIHGGLPLRGKVLNVHGASLKEVIENEALLKITRAIGLVPGQKADRSQLRYGTVYLTCDADEDGKSINALLINFFYTLWPELFDPLQKPFVFTFETPLIIATKGKVRKYWYADNYNDFDPAAHSGFSVVRAKGLAALTKDDWKQCLAEPKLIPILDDGSLKEALDLLFNSKRADDRKDFLGI